MPALCYGSGTASYTVKSTTTGDNITAQLNQTRTAGASVSYFPMPAVNKVANTGNTLSTILIVYDRGDSIIIPHTSITTIGKL